MKLCGQKVGNKEESQGGFLEVVCEKPKSDWNSPRQQHDPLK
jgi:hypothetical protein